MFEWSKAPKRGGEDFWRIEKDDGESASDSELSNSTEGRLQRQQVHST